jgi:exosortase N
MYTAIKGISKFTSRQFAIPVMLVYAALFVITLSSYIQWQSVNFITGMIAILLVAKFDQSKRSARYGILALLFSLISLLLPINTILYFAFGFTVLFLLETFYGKTNSLLFFLLIFLSPVFQYFINVFSFPIRLQLTKWAGSLMNIAGIENRVQGNIIFCRGNEYSVDPSCLGLNMLLLSMIAAIVIVSRHKNILASGKALLWVGIVLAVAFLLNINANLLRIILIVQFNILPGTTLHEIAGLACFLFYIILPLYFIVKRIGRLIKPGTMPVHAGKGKIISISKTWAMNFFITPVLVIASFKNLELKKEFVDDWKSINKIGDYSAQSLPQQTLKLEKKGLLVYIKKIPAFYNADHTPYICWKGSGYNFQNIEEEKLAGIPVFAGKLKNDTGELFTAWWYMSKDKNTIDQLVWRWDMLTTKRNYVVINVTAASKTELVTEISNIVRNNPFVHLLNQIL